MRCPVCHTLSAGGPRCAQCGAEFSHRRLGNRAVILTLLLLLGTAGYLGWRQLVQLDKQSGLEWDTEMQGPWVRASGPEESGISLYRIHIENQRGESIGPERRVFHAGDKGVASFHFRTQGAGRFQPRVVVEGPGRVKVKEAPVFEMTAAGFEQFRATLIPFVFAEDAHGRHTLRLEVEDLERGKKGFWETDIEVLPRAGE